MRKVTIKDVAKDAGVSPSTVSRVVSNTGKISQETCKRVYDSIEKLGYSPNHNARSLVNKSNDTIAVIVDRSPKSLLNTYFTDILIYIAEEMSRYNKELLLIFVENNEEEKDRIKYLIETNRIEGVIKLSVKRKDLAIDYLANNDIPTVVIGNPENKGKILWVDNDNEQAMYDVVMELVKDGKKKFCFVGGSEKFIVTRDRLKGFEKALNQSNISYSKKNVYQMNFSLEDAYKHADNIIKKDYDAIVCTDDMIAIGIARRAKELKKEVYVTGFNNSREIGLLEYPIPSVDIRTDKLGKWAVRLLMSRIKGDKLVTNKIIKSEFIKSR